MPTGASDALMTIAGTELLMDAYVHEADTAMGTETPPIPDRAIAQGEIAAYEEGPRPTEAQDTLDHRVHRTEVTQDPRSPLTGDIQGLRARHRAEATQDLHAHHLEVRVFLDHLEALAEVLEEAEEAEAEEETKNHQSHLDTIPFI